MQKITIPASRATNVVSKQRMMRPFCVCQKWSELAMDEVPLHVEHEANGATLSTVRPVRDTML